MNFSFVIKNNCIYENTTYIKINIFLLQKLFIYILLTLSSPYYYDSYGLLLRLPYKYICLNSLMLIYVSIILKS